MPSAKKTDVVYTLINEWTLPAAATLGSSVRAKGILLEIRARLPFPVRKSLDIVGPVLALRMAEGADEAFRTTSNVVASTLEGIESLPVIPREIQDILTITTTERHRWLKDGRLQSAGTRTVKLRGRAKKITFHVFDPRHVEEVLNGDLVSAWREDDAVTAAENRRQARERSAFARMQKKLREAAPEPASAPGLEEGPRPQLQGWEEFERLGLLR